MSRTVVIAFDIDPGKVGTIAELDDEDARLKIQEGRARYATDADVANAEHQAKLAEAAKTAEEPAEPVKATKPVKATPAEATEPAAG